MHFTNSDELTQSLHYSENLIRENSISAAGKNPILAAPQDHSQESLWNTLHENLQSQNLDPKGTGT